MITGSSKQIGASVLVLLLLALGSASCGTVTGGVLGGAAGAGIGAATHHRVARSAAIGAGVGAGFGALYDIYNYSGPSYRYRNRD